MNFDTSCLHAGYKPAGGEPRNIPIIQSTTFRYETSEDMGKLFDLEASGYFYSRLQNPTCDMVAAKIATSSNVDMIIANSSDIRIVHRIMDGRKIGTLFKGQKNKDFDMIEYVKNLHH